MRAEEKRELEVEELPFGVGDIVGVFASCVPGACACCCSRVEEGCWRWCTDETRKSLVGWW